MSLTNYKITDSDVSTKGVSAAPDKLSGTAAQNKAVFDRLIREVVQGLFNSLIDALSAETGASEIGAELEDVTGADNVQGKLAGLKRLVDARETIADAEAAFALKEDKSVTAQHIKAVSFNTQTGVFTFTRENGSTVSIDTALEKVATNWAYDETTQSLVLTLADGTTQSVPLSAFITETEFDNSSTIEFSVRNHVVTAAVKAGSITDSMLSSELVTQLQRYVSEAAESKTTAAGHASTTETNKKAAERSERNAAASEAAASESETAAGNSATAAGNSAKNAATSERNAEASAEDAEAWAVGKRGGVNVGEGDPAYHNNALYWKEQAQKAAGGGVTSFNNRAGTVNPQVGDYTAEMVGAIPTDAKGAAGGVASLGTDGKVPSTQIPSLDYVPTSQKGAANGVASLGEDGKVPGGQLPELSTVRSYYKQFSESDWSEKQITISAEEHRISGTKVIAQFSTLKDGVYYPNTWSAVESYASVDAQTGAITLRSETAYAGIVLLIG